MQQLAQTYPDTNRDRSVTLSEDPTPFIYQPLAQNHETGMTLLVRTRNDPLFALRCA